MDREARAPSVLFNTVRPALILGLQSTSTGRRLHSSFAVLDAVLRPLAPGLLLAQPASEAKASESEVTAWNWVVRVLPDAIVINANNRRIIGLRLPRHD